MNLKKIVIIRNAYQYDFGGGERFPVFLADELQSLGYKPLVISRSGRLLKLARTKGISTIKGWWWNKQNWSGKNILLFPIYLIWQVILFFWYSILFIREHPSVVHIQSKDDFIAATFAGKICSARVIWTDHADLKHVYMNHDKWYKNPIGKLVYLSAKVSDAITVVSNSERKLILNNFGQNEKLAKKIYVIYNGVKDVATNYKKTIGSSDTFIFSTVSRLVTDKGIGEIIIAFKSFSEKHKNCSLEIIGDGPEEAKFKKMAIGHKNIQFLGYQADPLKQLVNTDVYVHATYHEGFSVSLVEASMLGLPIIATSIGGNVEIISDNQTGLLVPSKDATSLQEAMEKLYADEAVRKRLGKNARNQYKKRFQFDKIVKTDFIKLYEK